MFSQHPNRATTLVYHHHSIEKAQFALLQWQGQVNGTVTVRYES